MPETYPRDGASAVVQATSGREVNEASGTAVYEVSGNQPGTDDVRVLLSLKAPDGTTRFVDQIVSDKPDQLNVLYFSWKTALTANYDVFHVHWPEWLVRHSNPYVRTVKYLCMVLFLARLTIKRTPVVRTIHNRAPHRIGSQIESKLLSILDRRVVRYIALNPFTEGTCDATLVRHGHYKDRFSVYERRDRQLNRVLFFGRIEPYKNVEFLIDQFDGVQAAGATLRIVGQIEDGAFPDGADSLRKAGAKRPRVETRFEFVSDSDLVMEVTHAHLVVLPYREMYNSGALLVALSLGTPVLAPRTEVNEWIRSEVGARWLMLYDELDAAVIDDALRRSQASGIEESPNLANRDWQAIALQHYAIYCRCRDHSRRVA